MFNKRPNLTPPHRKGQRHHHSQLKSRDQNRDIDNLNRMEELMQFAAGRSITSEEGTAATHLSASDQKEFSRAMDIADSLRKMFTP
jgi:hypothetical protein